MTERSNAPSFPWTVPPWQYSGVTLISSASPAMTGVKVRFVAWNQQFTGY